MHICSLKIWTNLKIDFAHSLHGDAWVSRESMCFCFDSYMNGSLLREANFIGAFQKGFSFDILESNIHFDFDVHKICRGKKFRRSFNQSFHPHRNGTTRAPTAAAKNILYSSDAMDSAQQCQSIEKFEYAHLKWKERRAEKILSFESLFCSFIFVLQPRAFIHCFNVCTKCK